MKIILSKPLKYKDKELHELDLVLDDLTGNDLIEVEEGIKRNGININAWEYSRAYLIALAAKALHLPAEALKQLSAKDFTTLVNETLSFLNNTDSEAAIQESSGK